MQWISVNYGDILVILVLALVVGLIIRGMIVDKKKGKSCGCSSCSGCAMAGACHKMKSE